MALRPVRVSQLNGYIKRVLETDPLLGSVSVIGEISNLKYHSSGHVYFSLKDENSTINCFLHAAKVCELRYELNEGMEIIADSYISVYEAGGRYSLKIRDIEVSGRGDLAIAFEKLKEKLQKEGLFDPEKKKPVPDFACRVAVVTSSTGAAVNDIIRTVKLQNDMTDILIYPVPVQGADAARNIAAAINDINMNMNNIDVIIAARGGGSIEDLWAFNEETVARAIFLSHIPVISAVGHETDFTIADFVADVRAATPTAAAQIAVPDTVQLKRHIKELAESLNISLSNIVRYKETQLRQHDISRFSQIMMQRVEMGFSRISHLTESIFYDLNARITEFEHACEKQKETILSMDPTAIMSRGYAAVIDSDRKFIRDTGDLYKNKHITIVFADGEADTCVTDIRRIKNGS